MEYNRLASYITFFHLDHKLLSFCDRRLFSPIQVDLRVCIFWDTDMTDVELEIIEPNGEKCYSFHNKTKSGGMLSRNFTHGYGPQEYLIRSAEPGQYLIGVRLFSSMSKYSGTTILLWITTFYGEPRHLLERWDWKLLPILFHLK